MYQLSNIILIKFNQIFGFALKSFVDEPGINKSKYHLIDQ
jgi:hypothetical protein